jgi:uncharacterized membrane protein
MGSSINFNSVQFVQFIAILLTGLLAGLFYGYDCSIIKGLGKLQDEIYLQSFQSINKVIQNPYFFISFMGNLLVLPMASWLSYKNSNSATFYLFLSASLVYFVGVFGITMFYNVPLNERLANFSISTSTESEISEMRTVFENDWNKYHKIRTIASIVAFSLTILSVWSNGTPSTRTANTF